MFSKNFTTKDKSNIKEEEHLSNINTYHSPQRPKKVTFTDQITVFEENNIFPRNLFQQDRQISGLDKDAWNIDQVVDGSSINNFNCEKEQLKNNEDNHIENFYGGCEFLKNRDFGLERYLDKELCSFIKNREENLLDSCMSKTSDSSDMIGNFQISFTKKELIEIIKPLYLTDLLHLKMNQEPLIVNKTDNFNITMTKRKRNSLKASKFNKILLVHLGLVIV